MLTLVNEISKFRVYEEKIFKLRPKRLESEVPSFLPILLWCPFCARCYSRCREHVSRTPAPKLLTLGMAGTGRKHETVSARKQTATQMLGEPSRAEEGSCTEAWHVGAEVKARAGGVREQRQQMWVGPWPAGPENTAQGAMGWGKSIRLKGPLTHGVLMTWWPCHESSQSLDSWNSLSHCSCGRLMCQGPRQGCPGLCHLLQRSTVSQQGTDGS